MNSLRFLLQQMSALFYWWTVISPWERAIRVRLGKHIKDLTPGVYLKIPYIHLVYKQNVRLEISDAPLQTLTTSDGQVLVISVIVGWRISDLRKLYLTIQNPENTILNMVMGAVSKYVTRTPAEYCTAEKIENAVTDVLMERDWGLEFSHVRVNDMAYTPTLRLIGENSRNFWAETSSLRKNDGE